jgi:PKD repeat protein
MTFNPYAGRIECRDLETGNLLWTSPFISNSSRMYAIGFNQDAVYGHDYFSDTLYAFNSDNGSILWQSPFKSTTFGAYPGALFTCNGDLIVNGDVYDGVFTMRINKNNGDTVWTNREIIVIGPSKGLAMSDISIYRITGGIFTPVLLTAIDIETGQNKYSSTPIPGDPDQEHPISIAPDGSILFWRDGGLLYSYKDDGSSLSQNWSYTPDSAGLFTGDISFGPDNSAYIFDNNLVKKLDLGNGTVIDSSVSYNLSQSSITVGFDSTVYLNTGTGNIYALSSDLQTIKWQLSAPLAIYCNPGLSKEGIMVITEAGTTIRAYKPSLNIKPVADFRISDRQITAGTSIDFFDQSSYAPSSWEWTFTGAAITSSFAQNPTGIVYNSPGIYDVKLVVQNSNGSDSITKECQIEVLPSPTSILSNSKDEIKIYPNPFLDVMFLEGVTNFPIYYSISDWLGRKVFEGSSTENQLNLEFLKPGFYIITLGQKGAVSYKILKE